MSQIEIKAGMKFTPNPHNGWVDMTVGKTYTIDRFDGRVHFRDDGGDERHSSAGNFLEEFTIVNQGRVEIVHGAHVRSGDVLVYNDDSGGRNGPFRDMTVGNHYIVSRTTDMYIHWTDDKGDECSCLHGTVGRRFMQEVPMIEYVIVEPEFTPADEPVSVTRTPGTYTIRGLLEDHGVLVNTDQAEAALKVLIAYARGNQ